MLTPGSKNKEKEKRMSAQNFASLMTGGERVDRDHYRTSTAKRLSLIIPSGVKVYDIEEKTYYYGDDVTLGGGRINILTEKTPINAVAANGVLTVSDTPLAYVENVNASGTLTVTGTPVADQVITIDGGDDEVVLVFKAEPDAENPLEVAIDEDNDIQASIIRNAINTNSETVTAEVGEEATSHVVTVTAVAAGTAGNSIVLTTNATGVAASGAGTLADGVNEANFFTVGDEKYKFAVDREDTAFLVTISSNTTTQAENIVAAITADSSIVNATNEAAVVTVSDKIKRVDGNSIVVTEISAALSWDGTALYTSDFATNTNGFTAEGGAAAGNIDSIDTLNDWLRFTSDDETDEVKQLKRTITTMKPGNEYKYTYKYYIPAANTNIDGIQLKQADGTPIDSAAQVVTDDTTTVTGSFIATGSGLIFSGLVDGEETTEEDTENEVFYVREVVITPTGLNDGVDGTPGYKDEICIDDDYLYISLGTNTINDNNWRRVQLSSF